LKRASFLLVVLWLVGCSATANVPLPPAIHVVPPGPAVPKDRAAFSGKWVGTWVSGPGSVVHSRAHILIVEEIIGNAAALIYAVGAGWELDRVPEKRPFWVRIKGGFVDGALRIYVPATGGTVTYRILPDDTLDATLEYMGDLWRAHLRRGTE